VDNDHCPGREILGDLVEVGQDDRCPLLRPASDWPPDEDHWTGRGPWTGKGGSRSRCRRRSGSAAGPGLLEDCLVGCRLHAEVADVDGVVPGCLERVGQERGEVGVDEELHAVSRSGSSRSRTASAA
jgi:hypothetical protein